MDRTPPLVWSGTCQLCPPLRPPSRSAAAPDHGQPSILLVTVFSDKSIGNIYLEKLLRVCVLKMGLKRRHQRGVVCSVCLEKSVWGGFRQVSHQLNASSALRHRQVVMLAHFQAFSIWTWIFFCSLSQQQVGLFKNPNKIPLKLLKL